MADANGDGQLSYDELEVLVELQQHLTNEWNNRQAGLVPPPGAAGAAGAAAGGRPGAPSQPQPKTQFLITKLGNKLKSKGWNTSAIAAFEKAASVAALSVESAVGMQKPHQQQQYGGGNQSGGPQQQQQQQWGPPQGGNTWNNQPSQP